MLSNRYGSEMFRFYSREASIDEGPIDFLTGQNIHRSSVYQDRKAAILGKRATMRTTRAAIKSPSNKILSYLTKSKFVSGWGGKAAYATAVGMAGLVGGYTVGRSMLSQLRHTQPVETIHRGGGYGPGYITWSKKSGMPANHLGTNNLMNSLHRMRHDSII